MTLTSPAAHQQLDSREELARRRLLSILSGSWVAQGIYAVVRLGVPDLLAGGPRGVDDLAGACGADPRALDRLLRALALLGIFTQKRQGVYELNPTSQLLRSGVPGSVRLNALLQGDEVYRSFAEIMHTMSTGRPAFERVYGMPFYDYLDGNADAARTFHESMGSEDVLSAVDSVDLSAARLVVDVGGGTGSTLARLLSGHPAMRGILFELPAALPSARAALDKAGVADRVECVAGDFFAGVPEGADTYLLSRVLHNWSDERALALLGQIRLAMGPHARLLVLERLIPEPSQPSAIRSAAGVIDLLMLVTLDGGDRTEAGYRDLLTSAGFEVGAVRHAGEATGGAVLEARRA